MQTTKNVERLANALRPDAEELADALQACFNDAVQIGIREAKKIEKRVDARLDKQDAIIQQMGDHLSRQDATLRVFWKQMGGNGKLPIDD